MILGKDELKDIVHRYQKKLSERVELDMMESFPGDSFSREYSTFRRESLEEHVGRYERFCNFSEKILKVSPKPEERKKLVRAIETAHLSITPEGAVSFASLLALLIVFFGIFLGVLLYFFSGEAVGFFVGGALKSISFSAYFFPLVLLLVAVIGLKPLSRYPLTVASKWRLKASNQMVLCILYVVMYMRHTSNLEHGIKFAGEHIGNPLALDLRKVLWDVETGKYVTIKESLDAYLDGWKDYSLEFIESFHLIESSLYESDGSRRISLLEKALEVILNGTYEKMLHYAHDLASPITMVYMMGVILPVLGLVLFPLMSGFLGGLVKWWHIAILYNIILPVFVYFYGLQLLEKRPTGYGSEDLLELHPEFETYTKIDFLGLKMSPLPIAIFVGLVCLLLGFLPLILFYASGGLYETELFGYKLLDFKVSGDTYIGPYGMWSMILSLF